MDCIVPEAHCFDFLNWEFLEILIRDLWTREPWPWNLCHEKAKYKNNLRFFTLFNSVKTILMRVIFLTVQTKLWVFTIDSKQRFRMYQRLVKHRAACIFESIMNHSKLFEYSKSPLRCFNCSIVDWPYLLCTTIYTFEYEDEDIWNWIENGRRQSYLNSFFNR